MTAAGQPPSSRPPSHLNPRLLEWIELQRAIGVSKVILYTYRLHPNMLRMVELYAASGQVEVVPLTLPGEHDLPGPWSAKKWKFEEEIVPYTDCFYRNLYMYDYISLLDTDEVIIPVRHNSLADMFAEAVAEAGPSDIWNFRNIYFLDNQPHLGDASRLEGIPPWHHILRHVTRVQHVNPPGRHAKVFFRTDSVVQVYHHGARFSNCLTGKCVDREVDTAIGRLNHYRVNCGIYADCKERRDKEAPVEDVTVWRWRDQILANTSRAMLEISS
jgi:hypothetical protein